jgi:flagella basal body P-ring formation protein FlgA
MSIWLIYLGMTMHPASCELIANDRIYGEDLARALPKFSGRMPGDTVVGYSPAPGARRIFKSLELQRIGSAYGVTVAAEDEACFEWSLQSLTDEKVRAAIRESLQSQELRVDVLAISRNQAPTGKISFPISGLLASTLTGPETPVTWRGQVLYRGSRQFSVWARVKISTTMSRVVATQLILPGQTVAPDQVRVESYDDFPLRNDIARSLEEVVGRMPRRAIPVGLPVFRSDLIEPFLVQRGDQVDVTAISGAAQLHLPALAESQGRQGDMITLKNTHSGKTFRGRVEGKDRALVLAWPESQSTLEPQQMLLEPARAQVKSAQ